MVYNSAMIKVQAIEYPGKEEIFNNFDKYKKIFLDDGIIPFRNAYCDREEQDEIFRFFGDQLGWIPNSGSTQDIAYEETHEKHMDSENTKDKNSLMLSWHLEHVHLKKDVYVGASWCMNLFKCDPDAGVTYFVNLFKFYSGLSEKEKEFLSKVELEISTEVGLEEDEADYEDRVYRLVQKHWLHGQDTLRVFLSGYEENLFCRFDGQPPTNEQKAELKEFLEKLFTFVYRNEEERLAHYWQEGDMLISDMFTMGHAVTGGFKPGERRLDGMFATLEKL